MHFGASATGYVPTKQSFIYDHEVFTNLGYVDGGECYNSCKEDLYCHGDAESISGSRLCRGCSEQGDDKVGAPVDSKKRKSSALADKP